MLQKGIHVRCCLSRLLANDRGVQLWVLGAISVRILEGFRNATNLSEIDSSLYDRRKEK
jgi:hypothetical protein